jgi:hypothetical protein
MRGRNGTYLHNIPTLVVTLINDILIIKYVSKTNNLFYTLSLTDSSTTSEHTPKQLHFYCDSPGFICTRILHCNYCQHTLKKNRFSVYVAVSKLNIIHVFSLSVSFLLSLFLLPAPHYVVPQKSSDVESFLNVFISSNSGSSHVSGVYGIPDLLRVPSPSSCGWVLKR